MMALNSSIGAVANWATQYEQRARARNLTPDHATVYEAIAAGDSAFAREAMRNLVERASEDTSSTMAG